MSGRAPIHATAVAIDGVAVLLMGEPGSGKSDLALRLIDRGAVLVSDDYTVLSVTGDGLIATAPPTIAGRIEIRGLGIVAMPHRASAAVAMIVRLDVTVERMPEERHETVVGVTLPAITLDPREASAPIKLEIALRKARETA